MDEASLNPTEPLISCLPLDLMPVFYRVLKLNHRHRVERLGSQQRQVGADSGGMINSSYAMPDTAAFS